VRAGAPTGVRDRTGTGTLDAHELAHETIREPVRQENTGWDMEAANLQLRPTRVGPRLRDENGSQRLRA
jgi:hypothetical protein